MATVTLLAVLGAFTKLIFWLGGLLCVVSWFILNQQYWAKNNYNIPVIVGLCLLGLAATPWINLLNSLGLFHRFLVPDTGTKEGLQRDAEAES